MKKSRKKWVLESTIDYAYDLDTKIRVWREESELKSDYDNSDLIDRIHSCASQSVDVAQAAEVIASIERVAAVQVIYSSRIGGQSDEGFVIYTDWP